MVASVSWDRPVRLWDLVTGAVRQMLEGHSDYVFSAAFSPGGEVVAPASEDNMIKLWDAVTRVVGQTLDLGITV